MKKIRHIKILNYTKLEENKKIFEKVSDLKFEKFRENEKKMLNNVIFSI